MKKEISELLALVEKVNEKEIVRLPTQENAKLGYQANSVFKAKYDTLAVTSKNGEKLHPDVRDLSRMMIRAKL